MLLAPPDLSQMCCLLHLPLHSAFCPAARARLMALLKPSLGGLLWRSAKADVAHELGLPPQVRMSACISGCVYFVPSGNAGELLLCWCGARAGSAAAGALIACWAHVFSSALQLLASSTHGCSHVALSFFSLSSCTTGSLPLPHCSTTT